jgi:hypothetical protein
MDHAWQFIKFDQTPPSAFVPAGHPYPGTAAASFPDRQGKHKERQGGKTGSFLGIRTVAGFVEDAETLAKLEEMGVDCVQESLIGAPKPLESLA